MSGARHISNIALTGFMGTGKSSVARLLASQLHFALLDTDEMIERETGKSVAEIFAAEGEPAFRKYEARVIAELAAHRRTIIATGGGVGANPAHLESLKQHALVVCLWASPEIILERVRHHTHRPLLQGPNPLAKIRELLAIREPFYKQADVLLNTQVRSLKEVAQQVTHQFRQASSPEP